MARNLRQLFWPDLKNKFVEKTDAPLVYSLPKTEKCVDVGISVGIPEISVKATEKSGLMTRNIVYMPVSLHAGISTDPEITDV